MKKILLGQSINVQFILSVHLLLVVDDVSDEFYFLLIHLIVFKIIPGKSSFISWRSLVLSWPGK